MTPTSPLPWLAGACLMLMPVGLIAVSLPRVSATRESACRTRQRVRWVALATLFLALASDLGFLLGSRGDLDLARVPLNGLHFDFPLSIDVNGLTLILATLVSFVLALIAQYSVQYLDGDREQARFFRLLAFTGGFFLLAVVSGNIGLYALGIGVMGLGLNRLLKFYGDRPKAVMAAHKKYLFTRTADLCLIAATVLIGQETGSIQFSTLRHVAEQAGTLPAPLTAAAWLIVVAVILKSAHFPFQGWLTQVMEAPTPVSALMHAGVVYSGAIVALRTSALLIRVPDALLFLGFVGLITVLIAALVMTTQTAVKSVLAWSTTAQLGFMSLELGWGLFPLALLHLVGHSLYKAHAFLSSGSVTDQLRQVPPGGSKTSGMGPWLGATVLGLLIMGGSAWLFGQDPLENPTRTAMLFVVSIALSQILLRGFEFGTWVDRVTGLLIAVGMAQAYLIVQNLFVQGLAPDLTARNLTGSVCALVLLALTGAGFLVVSWLQRPGRTRLPRRIEKALYTHLHNGLYADYWIEQLSHRFWAERVGVHLPPKNLAVESGHSPSASLEGLGRASVIPEHPEPIFERVIHRVAPAWPLDGFVAVNPYWGLIDQPFSEAATALQGTIGERVLMDRLWYADRLETGRLQMEDILQAGIELGFSPNPAEWKAYLQAAAEPPMRLTRLPELMNRRGHASISQYVVEQISHFLAAYYDHGQSLWRFPKDPGMGLFASWREYTLSDHSLRPMGLQGIRRALHMLPADGRQARGWALQILALPEPALEPYLLVLLKSVGGWASWCRHLLWLAELEGDRADDLMDLLTLRMVWEALLHGAADPNTLLRWRRQIAAWVVDDKETDRERARRGEALLRASEMAYRRELAKRIRRDPPPGEAGRPRVQAAFCLDVRSEVFRRHLEGVMPGLESLGCAGFFGLPLDYRRQGDVTARRLAPVLITPSVHAEETGPPSLFRARLHRLRRVAEWKQFKLSAAACFVFVEAAGLAYVVRLLADTLPGDRLSRAPDAAGLTRREQETLQCVLEPAPPLEEQVALAGSILTGLGLTRNLAPLVLLVGHGSRTSNNPHRSSLDCGACAGQTGAVNARIAAGLLNDPRVRDTLIQAGWDLDPGTYFLPALHETTTDRVEFLGATDDPRLDRGLLTELREALDEAAHLTRLERIPRLLSDGRKPRAAMQSLLHRSRDWSQVRPEWALAGNAGFIAAPRWRTRGMDLGGRVFLHDYDAARDPDFLLLTEILTAPLIVAHWINMQYYGSLVDNVRQGSGNKVLHNVVGGTVGVLEGNGGDLRIGLAVQSLWDSRGNLQHEPLRLSALIEAPSGAMDRIIAGNDVLTRLVDHRWLTICQIAQDGGLFERRAQGVWERIEGLAR